MPNVVHAIAKATIHLHLSAVEDAFRRQQEAGQMFWEKAAPALEAVFGSVAGEEMLVRIDRLEVSLHFDRWADFEASFVAALSQALEEKLRKIMAAPAPGVERLPVREALFSGWLSYLEKGVFPPFMVVPEAATMQLAILENLGTNAVAVERLRDLLGRGIWAMERLVRQYPASFYRSLTELYTGVKQEGLVDFTKELPRLTSRLKPVVNVRQLGLEPEFLRAPDRHIWRRVFMQAILQKKKAGWETLASMALAQATVPAIERGALAALLESALEENNTGLPATRRLLAFLTKGAEKKRGPDAAGASKEEKAGTENTAEEKQVPKPAAGATDDKNKPEGKESETPPGQTGKDPAEIGPHKKQDGQTSNGPRKESLGQTGEKASDLFQKTKKEEKEQHLPEQPELATANGQQAKEAWAEAAKNQKPDGVRYVANAGMVLLHPYLLQFFRELKLVDGSEFVDGDAQQRGAHLLQYLATGEENLPEHELLLPKLLCGIPFAIALEREVKLRKKEKDEADSLLKAVIKNWGVLGTTSPDGLREGFLQRDGKLEYRNGDWHLHTEKKAIDFLLTKLPWGIGHIKLHWMPDLLKVEWV